MQIVPSLFNLFLKNLTVAVSMGLMFVVLLQSQKRLVNWLFSLFMLTLALWSGGSFLLHFTVTGLQGRTLWQGMALLGLVTMPLAFYLLSLALSNVPSGAFRKVSVAFGLAGMAWTWIGVFTEGYVARMDVKPSLALLYLPKTQSPFYLGTLIYGFILVLLSMRVISWSVMRDRQAMGRKIGKQQRLGIEIVVLGFVIVQMVAG